MSFVKALAFMAMSMAMMSRASPISGRDSISFSALCDGSRTPTWDDCNSLLDGIDAAAGDDGSYVWTTDPGEGTNSVIWTQGNCQVTLVINTGDSVEHQYFVDGIRTIQQDCEANGTGGQASSVNPDVADIDVTIYSSSTNEKVKRDNTWETAYELENVQPDQYKQQQQAGLPPGSTWTLTKSDSRTNSVQASVDISADLFKIFSADASVSYSYSKTVEDSESETIPNNCASGQTGFLYWYPEYNQYHGGYSDGPTGVDIYIPKVNSDGSAAGSYNVVCSDN